MYQVVLRALKGTDNLVVIFKGLVAFFCTSSRQLGGVICLGRENISKIWGMFSKLNLLNVKIRNDDE